MLQACRHRALGRFLAAALIASAIPAAAVAEMRVDITRGNIDPLPIAIPDFLGHRCGQHRVRAEGCSGGRRRSRALRPVPSHRRARFHSVHRLARAPAAVRRLAADQCPGPGERQRRDPPRRSGPDSVPPLGRVRRAADDRARAFHPAGKLAPHRAYHRATPFTSASPARTAISTRGWFMSPRRDRRTGAGSGLP